jgi:site-specific DNA-methyltransferase (adenine-specific)
MNIESNVYNCDCMELMARYPNKYFDLAVVDPPYGIDASNMNLGNGVGTASRTWTKKDWDLSVPQMEYFIELFRVSKNQIIWGANYFFDHLPKTKAVIIWDKIQEFSGADFELAYTSFDKVAKAFRMSRVEAYTNQEKIHPTQKPIKLYDFCFDFAKLEAGAKVLDTHLGSGSSRIAARKNKLNFTACEIDKEYFDKQEQRYQTFISQLTLF